MKARVLTTQITPTVGSKYIVLGEEGKPESPISKILIRKS